jgi:hypothetical protein
VVDESSGCLDESEGIIKRSISENHFEMNKFEGPYVEDYLHVSNVIVSMVKDAYTVRKQLETCT